MKRKLMAASLILIFSLAACSCSRYTVHPNSINKTDSVMADTLAQAQSSIDNSRPLVKKGQPLERLAPLFSTLAKSFDVAYPSYNAWRSIVLAGKDPTASLATLNQNMADLTKALNAFRVAGGK